MVRCKSCAAGIEHEFTHGASGYDHHGCRCNVCRDVKGKYNRDRYDRNREARRKYNRDYRERNREAIREWHRDYRDRNREAERERWRGYYARNRDAILEQQRDYYSYNRDAILEQRRAYQDENREYVIRQVKKARQRLKSIPGPHNGSRWTPTDDAIVCQGDITLVQMCYLLGRSYQAVSLRRTTLRRNGFDI
jgi:hypothetical protein